MYVGFIIGLPEPPGFDAVSRELRRWREGQAADGPGDGSIDVVVHIPGPLYDPRFVGVRSGRRSRKEKIVQVHVALAPVELSVPARLAAALARGVSDAVELAISRAGTGDVMLPADRYRDAARQLVLRMARRKKWSLRPSRDELETMSQIREVEGEVDAPQPPPRFNEPDPDEVAVAVHLAVRPVDQRYQDLFAIEDQLVEAVEATGTGYFDGNEIGADECVLYFYGPRQAPLVAAIHIVLAGIPSMPPSEVRVCET